MRPVHKLRGPQFFLSEPPPLAVPVSHDRARMGLPGVR